MTRVAGANGVGRVAIEFEVANHEDVVMARRGMLSPDKVRRLTLTGVVDSGATKLVLPAKVVKQLGLPVAANVKVRYADGRRATRPTTLEAHLTILGREGNFTAIIEPNRKTALIGAIVLEDLDLLVDCPHNRVVPRDPRFIISEIE